MLGWMLAITFAGCGERPDNLPREAVSGAVMFEDQPMAKGTIQFAPTSDKIPTTGKAAVIDGGYSIPRAEGLVPGTYKVVIASFTEVAEANFSHGVPGKPAPAPKNLISKQFNKNSNLTAEVKGGQTNKFDFDVKKATAKEEAESSGNARSRKARPR
jgi:hypothetical protein